jgi:hypothetical protein
VEENSARVLGPTPHRFKRKRAFLIALLLILVILVGLYAYHNHSGRIELQKRLEETDQLDPDWRTADLEAHRRQVPEATNGMVQAMRALLLLPTPWPNWEDQPAGQQVEVQVRIDLAISFALLEPPAQLSGPQTKALRAELQRAGKAVAEARKLIDFPYGIQHVNWTKGFFGRPAPNTQKTRELANLLAYDILLQAQDRDFAQALRSARALLNTGRAIGDEPTLKSQLIRIAIDRLTFSRIEWTIAQGEPSPADLLALQGAVEQEAEEPLFYYGLRGERGTFDGSLENASFKELGDLLVLSRMLTAPVGTKYPDIAIWERVQALTVMLTIHSQRAKVLHYMNELVEASRLSPEQQVSRLQEMESTNPEDLPLMIRFLVPGLYKIGDAANRIRAQLRCTAVALAAERYRQTGGRWPTTLGELVPEYVAAIPLDPFNGQPLKMARHDQGIVIYSVGHDGADNGGVVDTTSTDTEAPGFDLGFRLWDVKRRRQLARPFKVPGETGNRTRSAI